MKKKVLTLALAAVLCLSLLPVSALAAQPRAVISVSSQDGNVAGAETTLRITVAENSGLSNLSLELDYDKTRLEPVLNKDKTCFAPLDPQRDVDSFTDWELDETKALFDGKKDIFFNGDILTVTFKIKEKAPLGDARVELKAQGQQLDGTEVELRTVSGGVKVLKQGSHVHEWGEGEITKEPTCTIQGVRSFKCPGCQATMALDIPALGHNWGPWEQTKAPTATAPGIQQRSCRNPGCDKTETREISGQTVTLTLDPKGGKVVPEERTVIKDAPIGLLPTPTREDHRFLGWFSDPDTGSLVDGNSSFSTDATLWAHWEEAPEEDAVPTLEAGTAVAAPGQKITLAVRLKGNPGIAGLSFALDYDEDVLTYEGFRDAGLEDWAVGSQAAVWIDSANNTKNGDVLLLTFLVNEDAREKDLQINFRDVVAFDETLKPVELRLINGAVQVRDLLPGDVNDDGKVDLLDLVTLIRYTVSNSVKVNKAHADVNGDGKIDASDVLALQAKLANAE